ncbi:hypothetical protein ACSQ6I_08750 [Anabaena sp. WFMT]|uniref:hypothetical protein n=1 Tax=Anabaena sp. WFMT TaxID=3449730 RepID=UPI003F23EF41
MSFIQLLEEVSDQVSYELQRRYNRPLQNIPFNLKLYYAVQYWTIKLKISEHENITNFILKNSQLDAVIELTEYLKTESTTKEKTFKLPSPLGDLPTIFKTKNDFYNHINSFLYQMSIRSDNMKIIVLIGFVTVAVGYWVYIINHKKEPQQETNKPEIRPPESVSNPPSSPVQRITRQFLVLVISASQIDFLNSLSAKRQIDVIDGEKLYELTKYLWTGSDADYQQIKSNISRYQIYPEQQSEYDICLVYIELKRIDPAFQPNVNQLDRYDAFRKLGDLTVNFEISSRLQMEAYGDFAVYNR